MKPEMLWLRQSNLSKVLLILILCMGVVATGAPMIEEIRGRSQTGKQINNAKQILLGCALFAADKGGGRYPTGTWDPDIGDFDKKIPLGDSAEKCFNDIFDTGIFIHEEFLFWSPLHKSQCAEEKPDEDGRLEPDENCWDYITGMTNEAGSLPLIFDASDDGEGLRWTAAKRHPWLMHTIVGFADGSSVRKEELAEGRRLKTRREGKLVDLCKPDPGKLGWSKNARIAAATPLPE